MIKLRFAANWLAYIFSGFVILCLAEHLLGIDNYKYIWDINDLIGMIYGGIVTINLL